MNEGLEFGDAEKRMPVTIRLPVSLVEEIDDRVRMEGDGASRNAVLSRVVEDWIKKSEFSTFEGMNNRGDISHREGVSTEKGNHVPHGFGDESSVPEKIFLDSWVDTLKKEIRFREERYFSIRKRLGRDVHIMMNPWVANLIVVALALGEFPLNMIVFRMFGEAEVLTWVMASTISLTIPILAFFLGRHLRHTLPEKLGDWTMAVAASGIVVGLIYFVSELRTSYILQEGAARHPGIVDKSLIAINGVLFLAALLSSFMSADPDKTLDQTRKGLNSLRKKLKKAEAGSFFWRNKKDT